MKTEFYFCTHTPVCGFFYLCPEGPEHRSEAAFPTGQAQASFQCGMVLEQIDASFTIKYSFPILKKSFNLWSFVIQQTQRFNYTKKFVFARQEKTEWLIFSAFAEPYCTGSTVNSTTVQESNREDAICLTKTRVFETESLKRGST